MGLALIAFTAAFLVVTSLGVLLFGRKKTFRSLSRAASRPVDPGLLLHVSMPLGARIEKLVKPFHRVLPRSAKEITSIQKRLGRAGYREKSYVNIFYSLRVILPLFLCILATVTGVYAFAPFFVYGLAAGLGFLAPDYWLRNRIGARQKQLSLGLPEALDLIVICVEAGLTMDKATMRASEEMRISQPDIADELNLLCLEQRAGCPRADAWRHLVDRTGVDSIASLATLIIQSEKFGSSVGKTLRLHAETLRVQRRQEVEEQTAKTTVKLVFPLVLLIFPSVFLVTMGPSMIIMFEGISEFLT